MQEGSLKMGLLSHLPELDEHRNSVLIEIDAMYGHQRSVAMFLSVAST